MREGECFLFMFLRFSQLHGEVISQMVTSIKHDCRCCGGGYRQVHWAQMQQVISSYSNMLYSENNLSYGYTPAPCYPASPNIHISVFINKLKFLFALALWAPVIYHRNIPGAVLTYCRSGIYCCHMVDFSGQCPSCGTAGKPLHRSSSLTVSLLGRASSFGDWFLCAVYNFIFKHWINEFSILDVTALQDQRQTCYSGHLLSWKDFCHPSRDIASAYWRCWSWDLH